MATDSISNSDGYDEPTDASNEVTTDEARDRLEDTMFSALECARNALINAPTALGKSHTAATTQWRDYPEITGGNLVIHIHQTKNARDEAVEKSREADGVKWRVYKGREDLCSTAAGKHDDEFTAPLGLDPSEWFEYMCDVRKTGFVTAHKKLERECNMPCVENGACPAVTQMWRDLHDDDGNPTVDVVHMTANFAKVEELIEGANLIFDERPSYSLELGDRERQQIRDSVSNLLAYRSDGEYSIADLVSANQQEKPDVTRELRDLLDEEVSKEWYFDWPETHKHAPEIGLAMLDAEEVIPDRWSGEMIDFTGRRRGEHDGVVVVIDSKGKLRHVHHKPDLSSARCVIGLDAFPSEYRWKLNTVDDLSSERVMSSKERSIWRRQERGLYIVNVVDDADRSYTCGWRGAGKERAEGVIHAIRRKYGATFRTCISPGSIEDDVRRFMREVGIESPGTMNFGGQNSRNDFMDELVGLLIGCIDLGDENIMDLLALGGQCAWPVTIENEDGEKVRERGRSYDGSASDTAREILESVREMNLAQAAGRYAREPGSSDSSARVYVWSAACPDSLVDEEMNVSYHSVSGIRGKIIEEVQSGPKTRREIQEEIGSDKSYTQECLNALHSEGLVSEDEGAGKNGASVWEWLGYEWSTELTDTFVQLDS